MRRMVAGFGVALVCVVAAAGGFLLARSQQGGDDAALDAASATAAIRSTGIVGSVRPDFTLPDLEGRPRKVDEWDRHVLVINFWATWCPPCRKEIPEFIALQEEYGSRGLQFLGIALEKPEPAAAFAAEQRMNYPVLAGEMEVVAVAQSYGNLVGALPYTVVVDRDGRIVFAHAGPLTREQVEPVVKPLL